MARTNHWVRQGRAAARSSWILAAWAVVLGLAATALGWPWIGRIAAGVALLMMLSGALEAWGAARGARRLVVGASTKKAATPAPSTPRGLPLRPYQIDGEPAFGTTVQIGPHLVYLDRGQHPLDAGSRAAMESIVHDPERVHAAYRRFIQTEVDRIPPGSRYGDDVRADLQSLGLHTMAFHYAEPTADVYLTDEEGNEVYSCCYRDGQFSDLEPRPILH